MTSNELRQYGRLSGIQIKEVLEWHQEQVGVDKYIDYNMEELIELAIVYYHNYMGASYELKEINAF